MLSVFCQTNDVPRICVWYGEIRSYSGAEVETSLALRKKVRASSGKMRTISNPEKETFGITFSFFLY